MFSPHSVVLWSAFFLESLEMEGCKIPKVSADKRWRRVGELTGTIPKILSRKWKFCKMSARRRCRFFLRSQKRQGWHEIWLAFGTTVSEIRSYKYAYAARYENKLSKADKASRESLNYGCSTMNVTSPNIQKWWAHPLNVFEGKWLCVSRTFILIAPKVKCKATASDLYPKAEM